MLDKLFRSFAREKHFACLDVMRREYDAASLVLAARPYGFYVESAYFQLLGQCFLVSDIFNDKGRRAELVDILVVFVEYLAGFHGLGEIYLSVHDIGQNVENILTFGPDIVFFGLVENPRNYSGVTGGIFLGDSRIHADANFLM